LITLASDRFFENHLILLSQQLMVFAEQEISIISDFHYMLPYR